MSDTSSALPSQHDEFIVSAVVPRGSNHSTGTIKRALELLQGSPEIASATIYAAAILGEPETLEGFLAADPRLATLSGGPHGWDALTYLCFSNFLKLDRARTEGFVRCAFALLDAGASPNTGFFEPGHSPTPQFESALYGACGVAHHPDITQLLLDRGADANDPEVVYHAAESYDNDSMKLLVQSARLTEESLATLLTRKSDWHDVTAIRWLLEMGADPRVPSRWNASVLNHALSRGNDLEVFQLLLDHGADPTVVSGDATAVVAAAREGRGDVLDAMARRGIPLAVTGSDALLAACARGHRTAAETIASRLPDALLGVRASAGEVLAKFASVGNTEGLRNLLDLGLAVDARFEDGLAYFGIARNSTPLHVAAWRGRSAAVRLLLERGADAVCIDGAGRSPLALAVLACIDSYWTDRRTPESVEALLAAGAKLDGVPYPSGYAAVDALLAKHGAALRSRTS